MQVTEIESEGLRRSYKVVVPVEDIEQRLLTRLEEIGRSVSWPGFRPGKVPLSLIKRRYGESVMGEILERAVTESSEKAISEQELRPAMQPKIEVTSFGEGRGLEFTMAMEVMPEIEQMDFSTLKLERMKAELADAKVEEAVAGIAARRSRFAPIEGNHKSAAGDVVVIDFVGRIGEAEFEGGSARDFELELGSNSFIPGFEDQLTGRKAGEHVTVNVTFPEDYGAGELAGKDVSFEVDVKEIRETVAVPVDDTLAGELGFENLDALRKSVREQLEREYASLSRAHLKRALLNELAAAHRFGLPDSVVQAEFESIWKQIEEEERRKAGGSDEPRQGENRQDEKEMRAECRAVAERRVRLGLLLGEVGRVNNISVSAEEVSKAVYAEASRYPGQEKQVIEFYQKTPEALTNLRAPLFEDKVIDFILEMAQVSARAVDTEELLKSPDELAADRAKEKSGTKKKQTRTKKKK